MSRRLSFRPPGSHPFSADVRARVDAHFRGTGCSNKANAEMIAKTVVLVSVTFGAYGLLLSGGFSAPAMIALCFAMGLGMAGIGAAVCHDALHGAYSARSGVNRSIGLLFDLIGANGYMWSITHNVIHHTYTNIPGADEDLSVSPLLRLSRGTERRGIHRFQHVYALVLYSLSTLYWVFVKDFRYFLQREIGPYRGRRHPRRAVLQLLGAKGVYYGYMVVLPLVIMPITWWQFGIGFLVVHLTAGTILGVVFQLAHVVEGPAQPSPDARGVIETDWLVHEMQTTANFACRNRALSWFVGGLNHQIEHHLFPRVCSVHYPAIRSIVRNTARDHGVPYHEFPTLRAALYSHLMMLRHFGRPEGRDAVAG